MKASKAAGFLVIGLFLALAGGLIYALHLIGAETLARLATIAVIGAALATVIAASSFPIRAWRSNIQPEKERHYHTKETRVIEHRPSAPAQMPPALPEPSMAIFPAMIGAAYREGLIQSSTIEDGEVIDGEVREMPPERKVWH